MIDDVTTQTVVSQLFNCISTTCCPTAGTIVAAAKCNIAYGHTGVTITPVTSIG